MPERPETVAILCGGRGTRLQERTHAIPKALVEIGGIPIVRHVIGIYAAQGFRRFLLLTGYRGEMIAEFAAAERWPGGVQVDCLPTGDETPTGGRVARAAASLGAGTFALTYADGVADVDLGAQQAFHRSHDAVATITLVRPHSQWGVAELGEGARIRGFVEKPRMERWVNGGFMFLEPRSLEYLAPGSVLEREPFGRMAADGVLCGFRHEGFWDCMDTYKDAILLNDLWETGESPWSIGEIQAAGRS
ncbi:MAG: NTP transferase domain-containing protein [Solirubrobacterales bacterium]|nr:NTP transferase domain-containing protein [Solirubrobacterales bacterium]